MVSRTKEEIVCSCGRTFRLGFFLYSVEAVYMLHQEQEKEKTVKKIEKIEKVEEKGGFIFMGDYPMS